MRQQELRNAAAYDRVEAPSAEPRPLASQRSAPAVPDMPKAAGVFMVMAYGALMGAFALTIHGARADFAIAMGFFYLFMFFAIPVAFIRLEGDRTRRPDLVQFLDRGIDTATGRISGAGALVQMLLVPVLLAFGVFAMGITYLLV